MASNYHLYSDSSVPDIVVKLIGIDDEKAKVFMGFETVIVGLQLLGNLCVDFRNGQDKVWYLLYPNLLW